MTSPDRSAERGSRGLRAVHPAGTGLSVPRTRESSPLDNLPLELSSFIGREREISGVKRLLADTRLVTLTGPGGSGKTRLALAVAQDLVEEFEDGVWWVELASLSDPELVPRAVASALGMREVPDRSLTEALVENLKAQEDAADSGQLQAPGGGVCRARR